MLGFAVITTAVIPLRSQTPPTQKPSFEVASVKPNSSGGNPGFIGPVGTRFVATNATLKMLLTYAYRLPTDQGLQVFGGPKWVDFDHFDVEGKLASEVGAIPHNIRAQNREVGPD